MEISEKSGLSAVNTDHQCLHIILNNLLDNALRYGNQNGSVYIDVVSKRNKAGVAGVAFVVSNKTGIASWPDPDKVFQKYYRSAGAQSISGTGLGLFLVASLANMLGGTCQYVPDDMYVRFELWLPT